MKEKTEEVLNCSMSSVSRQESLLSMVSHGTATVRILFQQIAETTELLYTLYNTDDREIEIIR